MLNQKTRIETTPPRKPSDLARQTLLELAACKLEPTPDNYARLYTEIERGHGAIPGVSAEAALHNIVTHLPRNSPEQVQLCNGLIEAADSRDWLKVQCALIDLVQPTANDLMPASEWAAIIRRLIRNAGDDASDGPHLPMHKWTALEIALNTGDDTLKLKRRLELLAAAWEVKPGLLTDSSRPLKRVNTITAKPVIESTVLCTQLHELLAQALETGIATRLFDAPALAAEASELAKRLREPNIAGLDELLARLKSLWLRVELQGNRQDRLQMALLDLLRLMVDNVGALVADDQWLHGQMRVVMQAISSPLSLDALKLAKSNLTEVIRKQNQLKQGLSEVRTTLKQMVVSFIDELGNLSAATGDYHDSVEHLSQKIRQTDDVNQLNQLLEEVLRETRDVQTSTLRSRQEVLAARQQVDAAERKVVELETELQQVSEKVQTDYLTGTLNRRGLKDAFDRELAIAEREKTPTSVALLDIDDFKALNDHFGHQVGDDILVHLARLIKETVRPGDSVARYGGEEFLILLPDAEIDQATAVLTRLQRALTKHFFLQDNCKVLITFSTGVTRHLSGETQEAVIARADGALYQAKRTGKNRVVAVQAESPEWQPLMRSSASAPSHRIPA